MSNFSECTYLIGMEGPGKALVSAFLWLAIAYQIKQPPSLRILEM